MAFGDQTQYDYLFNALAQKYPAIASSDGNTSSFQFLELPMEANWVQGSDSNAFQFADATSVRLDGFYAPGGSLSTAYQDYVLSISPKAGSDGAAYQKAAALVAAADNALEAKTAAALAAFNVFLANNPDQKMTYSAWLLDSDFSGPDYQNDIEQMRAARNDQGALMTKIVKAVDGPLGAAQAAANPWSQTMNISQGGAVVAVPTTIIGGDLAGDTARWMQYAPNEYDFDVTISAEDTITSPWNTTYTTHTSFDPCYGFSSSTTIDSQRVITDKNYKLRVCAVGINAYPITRGEWFHEDLLVPTEQIVEGSPFSNDTFFGYAGSLHLVPHEILVMYRPTIELTVSTDIFTEQIEGVIKGGLEWVDLFGFHFDLQAGATLTKVQDEVKTTITIAAPASQVPQVIGVLSSVHWNQNGPSAQALRAERVAYSATLRRLAA